MGFWEIVVILLVGVVVLGPRKLPDMMRTAGQWVSKIRRLSVQLRAESGIDDIIRAEGLEREIRELRGLASSNVLGSIASVTAPPVASPSAPSPAPSYRAVTAGVEPTREREWPEVGCDAGGALPDEHAVPPAPVPEPPPPVPEPEAPKLAEGAPVIAPRKPPEGTVPADPAPLPASHNQETTA